MFNQSYESENVDLKRINNLLRYHKGGRLHNPSNSTSTTVDCAPRIPVYYPSWKEILIACGVFALICFVIKSLFSR